MSSLELIYLDDEIVVVNKRPGDIVQGDRSNRKPLVDILGAQLDGVAYIIHRLDRPVSGVILFARNKNVAAHLNAQMQKRTITKTYFAMVEGQLPESGVMEDCLERTNWRSRVVSGGKGVLAQLNYHTIVQYQEYAKVEIQLETGRHHQIRVQFAHRGFPIIGDERYGSQYLYETDAIALHAHSLTIYHPVQQKEMTFTSEPAKKYEQYELLRRNRKCQRVTDEK